MHLAPRSFTAPNASPMTMDGTITYVVGHHAVVVIDPGSDDPDHLDTIAAAIRGARGAIIITHDHPDHSAGAAPLAGMTGLPVRGGAFGALPDGAELDTDEGPLVTLSTPGHAPDHIALHWPAANAIFCGDLMMGGLDTAVVAAPEGHLHDYLASLERLRSLRPTTIYPAHGPPFTEPEAALDRYTAHRRDRLHQVRAALEAGAEDPRSITDLIYGDSLQPGLRPFAEAAVSAYLEYIEAEGAG